MFGETPQPFGRGNVQASRRGKKGSVLIVALCRPQVRNAFNDALYEDLIEIMAVVSRDSSLSSIVLTGMGDYFSSGADLKDGNFEPETGGRRTLSKPSGRFMMAIIAFPKVIAAAVNGPAVGIGVTLLMHCDLVFCSDRASLWAPFTRLALVPELCSSVSFVESMGLSKANELLLLGRKIDAQQAVEWNIASRVVKGVDQSGDPFHKGSLASHLALELDKHLLSLPLGDRTAEYFVALMKGARRHRMEAVCKAELLRLDERFNSGQVHVAAGRIKIGSSRKPRSRL